MKKKFIILLLTIFIQGYFFNLSPANVNIRIGDLELSTFNEIMIFGIAINVAAGIGALTMGFFDDKFGGKKTIQISNIALAFATLLAVLSPDKTFFWISGMDTKKPK